MKNLSRRLRRLEERLGLKEDPEFAEELKQQMAAARQRLKEAEAEGSYTPPPEDGPHAELCRKRVQAAMRLVASMKSARRAKSKSTRRRMA
jgi:hypothetical protein